MDATNHLKLGLFSYSYHLAFGAHEVFQPEKKMELFEFIDHAKEIGFDGIMIDPMHLTSYEDSYLEKVVTYTNKLGLYMEYGTVGVTEKHLLEQLEIAKKLGSTILRTYIGFNPLDPNINIQKEKETAINALNAVKSRAEELNIKIAIENHCDLKTDELILLIEKVNSPFVGVCVDLGNFLIHLENPVDSVKKLAPYIISTHFKDYAYSMENWGFKYFGVALGDGIIDLKAILAILVKESGLTQIMLEIPVEKELTEQTTLKKKDDFVMRSAKYAREVLGIK